MGHNVETSEPKQVLRGEGQRFSVAGDVYAMKMTGEETGGAYALVEVTVSPQNGPPLHVHSREDEGFYVLSGDVEFTIAGKAQRALPGTVVHVPRGVEHTLRNIGDGPARMLVWVTPAGFEKFFQEVGDPLPPAVVEPAPVTQEQIDRLMAAAPRFGVEIRA